MIQSWNIVQVDIDGDLTDQVMSDLTIFESFDFAPKEGRWYHREYYNVSFVILEGFKSAQAAITCFAHGTYRRQ